MALHRIERDVDAVERAIVFSAVLQMIDDLQRRAQRVGGGPGAAVLAVDVENEAPDRHGRIGAVTDQVVPIAIAQFGGVGAECGEQVLGVAWREITGGERVSQGRCLGTRVLLPQQAGFQAIEPRNLFRCGQDRAVRHVVGGAHEAIERENGRAMPRRDQQRGDGKILVAMRFRGGDIGHPASSVIAKSLSSPGDRTNPPRMPPGRRRDHGVRAATGARPASRRAKGLSSCGNR